ncbi:MAG: hypothetical protein KDJ19_05250 [Hyphomicrobiaceae bacterium]|nr:hypothetical protein [Hyphomicrobiaceae bacterium]MCC0023248.1 hypothetical protein [Hyphomicrobiaceae bacterium]
MATTYIAGNSTSTTIGDLADGDDIYVLPFATLYVTGDSAIESAANANNSHHVWVEGAVTSDASIAVFLDQDGSAVGNHVLYVAESGSISGTAGIGVRAEGRSSSFNNLGEISGTIGLYLVGATSSQIKNDGSIFGYSTYGFDASSSLGIELVNTGLIQGWTYGIYLTSSSGRIVNSGTIAGGSDGIHVNSSDSSKIYNNATGVISGNELGDAVSLGIGDDLLVNRGQLLGDVSLNGGNDTFKGRSGSVDGQVKGGLGNDTLIGSTNDDDLSGEDNNDILKGRDGDDILNGGNGRDHLYAGMGDDQLTGGAQKDYFHFGRNQGDNTITDYVDGTDKINLTAFHFSSATAALKKFVEIGSNHNDKVGFDYKDTYIEIHGADLGDIKANDLII